MKRQFFGTDGVRGPYGGPVINEAFAARLGYAVVQWLRGPGERRGRVVAPLSPAVERRVAGGVGRVFIGRDTRGSGPALEAAIARGLRAAGGEPVSLGVVPTPAVARAVRAAGVRLGVVITASHNPASDNGIKFFGPDGVKLTDADEALIEGFMADAPREYPAVALPVEHAVEDYVSAAARLLPARSLRGWRIVIDTANGATCATTPAAFRALGAEIVGLGDAPDGTNINAGVGSEHPQQLAARVVAAGARLGLAHDGDGDRCVLCDELGAVLDGDEILTILATRALARGELAKGTLVVTRQSNLGVDAAIAAAGGRVLRTDIGDRYVIERMLAEGATLGGESSGHIICSDVSPTGDGLVAALKAVEVMLATGRPLSELRGGLKKFPQQTAALKVREKRPLEALAHLPAAIRAIEGELGARGRVLVRYSGTESKLRLLVEGPDVASVEAGIARLKVAVAADGLLA
ncbi:MAG: phosphoglucosamine mutase [Opitutaceae bacterium]|nr:phosphoglucosamine mutase [Opitutaceae bacterium]